MLVEGEVAADQETRWRQVQRVVRGDGREGDGSRMQERRREEMGGDWMVRGDEMVRGGEGTVRW